MKLFKYQQEMVDKLMAAKDQDVPDFDEHMISIDAEIVEAGDFATTIDCYLTLSTAKDTPESISPLDDKHRQTASLSFVGSGLHLDLCGIPFTSLRSLAKWINETVKNYQDDARRR